MVRSPTEGSELDAIAVTTAHSGSESASRDRLAKRRQRVFWLAQLRSNPAKIMGQKRVIFSCQSTSKHANICEITRPK